MSALGNYVHLNWQNYRKHGTYTLGEGISNFKEDTFDSFQQIVSNRARKLELFISSEQLKQFETSFNTKRKEQFELLVQLYNSSDPNEKNIWYQFIGKILKDADKELYESLERQGEKVLNNFLDSFQPDMATQNLTLKNSSSISQNNKIKKINKPTGKYTYINTLLNMIDTVQSNIRTVFSGQTEFIFLQNKGLGHIKASLNRLINTTGKKEPLEKIMGKKIETNIFGDNGYLKGETNLMVRKDVALIIYDKIKVYQSFCYLKHLLTLCQAYFTENFGVFCGPTADSIANKSADQILESLEKVVGSKKVKIANPQAREIIRETKEKYFESGDKDFDFGLKATVEMSSEKVDFLIQLDDGKILNVSAKNYKMKDFYMRNGKEIEGTIKLVSGSPLTTFLIGAEVLKEKMGTHFLNLLAEHKEKGDSTTSYSKMREQGLKALKLLIVYSAISGDLTLKDQQVANIFMIDSKAKITKNGISIPQYTYFFSINNMIQDYLNGEADVFYITPDLDSIKLKNEMYNKKAVGIERVNSIQKRIKNLLQEAHKRKISAAVSIPNYFKKKGVK